MNLKKFEIERRENLSYEYFAREYLYPLKPVVLTNALRGWRALERWTPEFFKQEFGDIRFVINEAEYGQPGFKEAGGTEFTMSQFIDRVLVSTDDNPAPYLRNKPLYAMFPTLKTDVQPLPEYIRPNWLEDRYLVGQVGKVLNGGIELYIGGKGRAFPVLHYDAVGSSAFLMQIYGRKEYVVYPPDQEPYLYPLPQKKNLSSIENIDHPDLNRFPLFEKAVPTTFFLEPGELLYVPSHWWHTAKILTPSITISVNVVNQSNWHELIKFFSLKRRNPLVWWAGYAYLMGAGAWRAYRDRDWRKRAQEYV